jgi:periplasmic protein TonB
VAAKHKEDVMPRDLFGDVTAPSVSVGNRKWYTVPLSLAAHVAVIVPVVLVPLLATDVLPLPREYNVFLVDPPTPPDPPPPVARRVENMDPTNPNVAPTEPPPEIVPEKDLGGFERDISTTPGAGVVDSALVTSLVEPPSPPPAPPKEPLRVGGVIRPPERLRNVVPVYPPIAQSARVQGTIILEALIGADGKVQNVRVMRSVPLLDQAAIDAVRQWEYAPTLLNGIPVPVLMTVTVDFRLNR